MSFIERIFSIGGTPSERALKTMYPIVDRINEREALYAEQSDDALRATTDTLRERLAAGETLDELLPDAFALVREAAKRQLGQRHFDVQLMGGIALHRGGIAEMRTGEGKTLVATLPVYLNALTGKGVHVVTVNDYLSRRDAVWMGQIYHALGLTTAVINHQASFIYDPEHVEYDDERDEEGSYRVIHEYLKPCTRREAYEADITYGTNVEFGFDYLRDNIAYDVTQVVQREHHFAIVDEIDSILIDEARTPLIISAPAADAENLYQTFAGIAKRLKEEEHYTVDEKLKAIQLTEEGIAQAEKLLGVDNIYTERGIKYVHHLETAVRAKALFHRDKHYVVRGDEIVIVDEFTGRLQPGRRWSEGLHQAVEAKEGVAIQKESRTFASITYQNYFRMYDKLAGMTGTAATSQEEFYEVYALEVVTIPTNRPAVRRDRNDLIYQTEQGKLTAIARKVRELYDKGQPVLIGTVSIEKNEQLSAFLTKEGIPHEVLNAKNHEHEGEIVAQAGRKAQVTIATNMAGRGVDIKLGGNPGSKELYDEVRELGGLFVLGTERHEARRIDDQLRGRSGRQGDPGETQFFISFDDDLMRVFGSERIKSFLGKMGVPEDQPVENRMVTKQIEAAQQKIEGFHFDARKHVLSYDNVLNKQRQYVYERRRKILMGQHTDLREVMDEIIDGDEEVQAMIDKKREELGGEEFAKVMHRLILQTMDSLWMEHLELMEYTRSSVNLRAYGQRDPLIEYKREARRLFDELKESMRAQVIDRVPYLTVGALTEEERRVREAKRRAMQMTGAAMGKATATGAGKAEHKIGRNEQVTITNGKETKTMKFKKAEPLIEDGEWKLVS